MSILVTILAFTASLQLLVLIHEGGHFAAARFCGVRVLRFSVGFGPILWSFRGKSGTEYALSLLPLGGYVKMLDSRDPGLAEESGRSPQDDFNRKKLWQRALIVFAGPFMNLVLAVLIYWGIGLYGTFDLSSRVSAPAAGTPAAAAGVKGGDYVIEIGGEDVKTFTDLQMKLLRAAGTESTISVREKDDPDGRNAVRYRIDLRSLGFEEDPAKAKPLEKAGLLPWQGPLMIEEVISGSAAESAGLMKGDEVTMVDGKPARGAVGFVKELRSKPGETVSITVKRDGAVRTVSLAVPEAKDERTGERIGRIGVRISGLPDVIRVRLGPLDALGSGLSKLRDTAILTLRVMGKMIVGEASVKNLSGPVAIADYAGQAASVGLVPFLSFTAMMSISLGILNLLPIPVLDGGYLAAYAYELVTRRRPSEAVVGLAQRAGLALILLITVVALVNDITRLAGG